MKKKKGPAPKNYVGKQSGRLTIVEELPPIERPGKRPIRRVLCKCTCGSVKEYRLSAVAYNKGRRTRSCGCILREMQVTHGMSKTRTYRIWWGMVNRGLGKQIRNYYADRGIGVCKRWLKFENFLKDMGERPTPKHTLERINNDKGYSPSNCKWATMKEQQRNKRSTHRIEYEGKTYCITDFSKMIGMDTTTLLIRLRKMPLDKAISEPIKRRPVVMDGEEMSLAEASRRCGLKLVSVLSRLNAGWSLVEALSIPALPKGGRKPTDYSPVSVRFASRRQHD